MHIKKKVFIFFCFLFFLVFFFSLFLRMMRVTVRVCAYHTARRRRGSVQKKTTDERHETYYHETNISFDYHINEQSLERNEKN